MQRLGIFTTVTKAEQRGDNFADAYSCYEAMADVVTIIDGDKTWPHEFNWPIIGEHFQKGYEACNAEWVIHADLDFIFHEKSLEEIHQAIDQYDEAPALSFWKLQFIQPDRFNLKSRLVIAVNKKRYGNRIKFNAGGDLCQPSLDGKEISIDDIPEARVPFFNYEKLTKTKDQVANDVGRMDRAYFRHFKKHLYSTDDSGSDASSLDGWLHMIYGRAKKPSQKIKLTDHPIFVQDTIRDLTPDQFGYDGFTYLERNSYVKSV